MTWSSFDPPVTTQEALDTYDGWVAKGDAVHTEGGRGIMATAWREFLTFEEVLTILAPVIIRPGWKLWAVHTPKDRLTEIQERLDPRRRQ